jgi:hypothetical protein
MLHLCPADGIIAEITERISPVSASRETECYKTGIWSWKYGMKYEEILPRNIAVKKTIICTYVTVTQNNNRILRFMEYEVSVADSVQCACVSMLIDAKSLHPPF